MEVAIRPLQPGDPPVFEAAFAALGWRKPASQYERYLKNRLREAFDCQEVPIRLVFRKRSKVELPPQ